MGRIIKGGLRLSKSIVNVVSPKKPVRKKFVTRKIIHTKSTYSLSLMGQDTINREIRTLPLAISTNLSTKVLKSPLSTSFIPYEGGLRVNDTNLKILPSRRQQLISNVGLANEFGFTLLDHLVHHISKDMFFEDEARYVPSIFPNFLIKLGFSKKLAKMQTIKKTMSSFPNINYLLKRIIRKKYPFFSFFKSNRRFQNAALNPLTGVKLRLYKNYAKDKFLEPYEYSIKKHFKKKANRGNRFIRRVKFKPGYIVQ